MAIYGGYRTCDELSRGAMSSVWSASRSSTQKPRFALKLFQPAMLEGLARTGALTDDFLRAAGDQQRVADKRGSHWAPIVCSGRAEAGAYYVTRLYRRSAEHLVLGKVALTGEEAQHIVRSVLQALRELGDTCDRAHGNLKPSNILIESSGKVTSGRVVLTDPAPPGRLGPTSYRDDLRAVGEILYRLVLHRETAAGAIGESEEWSRLGVGAEDLRSLCQRLMAPSVGLEDLKLETLVSQVPRTRQRRTGRKAALAILALLVVGIIAFFLSWDPPRENFPPDWGPLCQDYSQWFLAFDRRQEQPERRAVWAKDPDLKRILAILDEARSDGVELDPRNLIGIGRKMLPKDLAALGPQELPPECQARLLKKSGHTKCERAWAIVSKIKKQLEEWPRRQQVMTLADDFGKRGWRGQAGYLRSLCDKFQPPTSRLVEAIDAILDLLADKLAPINERWQKIQSALDEFARLTPSDPILRQYKDYVDASLRAGPGAGNPEDFAELLTKVDDLSALAGQIQEALRTAWGALDKEWFVSHGGIQSGQAISPKTFTDWIETVKSEEFRLDPKKNPFADKALADELAQAESALQGLSSLERLYPDPKSGDLGRQLEEVRAKVLAERGQPFCLARMNDVAPRAKAMRDQLSAAQGEIRGQVAALRKVPAEPDPRQPVQISLKEVDQSLRPRASRRPQFQPRVDAVCDKIKDPLVLEWIVAYEKSIRSQQDALARAEQELRRLKQEIDKLPVDQDPRPELRIALDKVAADIRQLEEVLKDPLGPPAFQDRLTKLNARPFWKEDWSQAARRLAVVDDAEACKKELDVLRGDLGKRTEAVQEVRQRALAPTTSTILTGEWERWRDRLIAKVPDAADLRSQASDAASVLQRVDAQFALAQTAAFGNGPLPGEIAAAKRDEALRSLLSAGEAAIREAADGKGTVLQTYWTWTGQVPELAADFQQIQAALDEGYGLTEARPAGKTVGELDGKWNKAAILKDFARVVDKTAARLRGLGELPRDERAALVTKSLRKDDFAVALNAWRMMANHPWPTDAPKARQAFDDEWAGRKWLAAQLPGGPRKDQVRKELTAQGPPRWRSAMESMASESDVKEAMARMTDFAVAEDSVAGLSPPAQFNYHTCRLAEGIEKFAKDSAGKPAGDQKSLLPPLLPKIRQFLAAVEAMRPSPIAKDSPAEKWLADLAKLVAWEPKAIGASKAGPATRGWNTDSANDTKMVFSWPDKAKNFPGLEFVAVKLPDGNTAFLSSTEVTIRLFAGLVNGSALDTDTLFKDLIELRGWKYSAYRRKIEVRDYWQALDGLSWKQKLESDGKALEQPTEDMPIQYVLPRVAMWAAAQAGCRLPTSGEWLAAYNQYVKDPVKENANLRDQTWAQWHKYIKDNSGPGMPPAWPDNGIFWPANATVKRNENAVVEHRHEDGHCFFAKVDAGNGPLHHLVGNVAEMVYDDPSPAFWAQADALDRLDEALRQPTAAKLQVIGGSALSPPEVELAKPYPIQDSGGRPYSDVGFRLAFSAPNLLASELAARLVARLPIIPPARAP